MPIRQRYQQIADCFEEAVRANLATPDRLLDICEAIAVSRRTLSRAVRDIHGPSSLRFGQSLRLTTRRGCGGVRKQHLRQFDPVEPRHRHVEYRRNPGSTGHAGQEIRLGDENARTS